MDNQALFLRNFIESGSLPVIRLGLSQVYAPTVSVYLLRKLFKMGDFGNPGTTVGKLVLRDEFPYQHLRQRAISKYQLLNPLMVKAPNGPYKLNSDWETFTGPDYARTYVPAYVFLPKAVKLTVEQERYDYSVKWWQDMSNFAGHEDFYMRFVPSEGQQVWDAISRRIVPRTEPVSQE